MPRRAAPRPDRGGRERPTSDGGDGDGAGVQGAGEGEWHRANGMMWPASCQAAVERAACPVRPAGEPRAAAAECRHGDTNGRRGRLRADGRRHRRGVRAAGYETIVREVDERALARGLGRIEQSMATAVATRPARARPSATRPLERLRGVTDLEALAGCDLVIEAVTENLRAKQAVFMVLDARLPAGDDPGQQHLVDPDHRPGERHEAAGPGARDALHEPGAGDAADRVRAGDHHQRRDAGGRRGRSASRSASG